MRSLVLLSLALVLALALAALPSVVLGGAGLYSSGGKVVELTAANFKQQVQQGKEIWLVEFYAPWCGHCKSLAPEWAKAAAALDGVVKVGAVNMDEHQSVGAPFNIRGFPTIKLFGADKSKPVDYNGGRTASAIAEFALKEAEKAVRARLGQKASSGSGSGSGSGGSGSGSSDSTFDGSKVVQASDASFNKEVIDNDELVLVEFYAPWCGHCKNLAPAWKAAAAQLTGVAKLVAVDATVHQGLASKFGIKGFPTIKVFKPGKKDSPDEYNGGRSTSDIVTFAKNAAEASAKPRPVVQLTSQAQLDEQCKDKASLCIVTFLPHILDGGAKTRNQFLDVLKQVANKHKAKPVSYLWAEAGAQPALEERLLQGNTFYPVAAALNLKKSRAAPMVGAFTADGLGQFLGRLVAGREPTVPLQGEVKIDDTPAWDGKDGQPPVDDSDKDL